MKGKKLTMAVNLVLALIVVAVGSVCFVPKISNVSLTQEGVYRSGDIKSRKVSLMFNVYWGTPIVYEILDTLDNYGVKCTFFIGGCWADDNEDCLLQIVERGHELANHGYFHKEHDKLSYEQNVEEIKNCQKFLLLSTGVVTDLFAPPSGAYNNDTVKAAQSLGYRTVLWTKDTIDWRDKDESLIYRRAIGVKGGALVLMHPMQETANALGRILSYYRDNGYFAVTVSENIQE